MSSSRVINFGAGPSALPESVLEDTAKALLNFNNTGIGIAEISHRSKEFGAFLSEFEGLVREQLDVPPTHTILFAQGGGTGQFSAVVLNMVARHYLLHPELEPENRTVDYVLTGSWSKRALEEANRLGEGTYTVNTAVDSRQHSKDGKSYDNIPPHEAYSFSQDPALIYYCENETVNGVQFSSEEGHPAAFPFHLLPKNKLLPLVGDYSSSFLSRPIPRLADHAIIYAGVQKNVGPAGLTILIVRQDCLVDVDAAARLGSIPVPISMSYKYLADGKSLPNTPPVLAIYMSALVLKRSKELGGVQYYEDMNRRKAQKVYDILKVGEEKGVLRGHVKESARSWMNIVFEVIGDGKEEQFLKGAQERGMKGLKGHRSVGGIRVSLYNAITEQQTDTLVNILESSSTKLPRLLSLRQLPKPNPN
ncbi:pyridoxal phosphate-dependent transferase [Cyathus striatus]|nr:pyridoxal phosphate-dependent transferase [Cyathus striatus]